MTAAQCTTRVQETSSVVAVPGLLPALLVCQPAAPCLSQRTRQESMQYDFQDAQALTVRVSHRLTESVGGCEVHMQFIGGRLQHRGPPEWHSGSMVVFGLPATTQPSGPQGQVVQVVKC